MTDVDNADPLAPQAAAAPAAVVTPQPAADSLIHQSFPVRQPEQDLEEFYVYVRASQLKQARAAADANKSQGIPWDEILLAISTTSCGAFLGALTATFEKGSKWPILFFNILPAITVGAFVAYLFMRASAKKATGHLAGKILETIPDPDKAR